MTSARFTIHAEREQARVRPSTLVTRALRYAGALAVLAVGAIHLQQYAAGYSNVPVIGPLFALNFAGATVLGLALLAPIERLVPARLRNLVVPAVALAAIGLAVSSLVGLYIAEHGGLFGLVETGYRPVIVATIATELATVALLTPVALRSRS